MTNRHATGINPNVDCGLRMDTVQDSVELKGCSEIGLESNLNGMVGGGVITPNGGGGWLEDLKGIAGGALGAPSALEDL